MERKISKLWRKDTKILSICFIVSNKVDWRRLIHLEVYVVYFYWVEPFAVFWINVAFLRRSWWLIFIVDLIEFEITKRHSRVWGYFQRHWNTDGRPTIIVGGHDPKDRNPQLIKNSDVSWAFKLFSHTGNWITYSLADLPSCLFCHKGLYPQ